MPRKFAVIGLGNFGATVARELVQQKCEVTAIDSDKARVQAVRDTVRAAIVADATERSVLESLEPAQFEYFVVSTGEDTHASILITLHLVELGARKVFVKAKSVDHAKVLRKVGATDAIIPEIQSATRLAHTLAKSNLVDYLPLTGEYMIAELTPPAGLVGKTLRELDLRARHEVQVVAVKDSQNDNIVFAPGGNYLVRSTDILIVIGNSKHIERLKD